jgi:hypothetical protein
MVSCGWIGSCPRAKPFLDLFTNREEHLADRPKTKILNSW